MKNTLIIDHSVPISRLNIRYILVARSKYFKRIQTHQYFPIIRKQNQPLQTNHRLNKQQSENPAYIAISQNKELMTKEVLSV